MTEDGTPKVSGRFFVHEPSPIIRILGGGVVGLGVAVIVAQLLGASLGILAPQLFLLGFMLLSPGRFSWTTRRKEREVVVTPEGLVIDGRTIPRSAIANGYFQPIVSKDGTSSSRVRLMGRRTVVLEAEASEASTAEILRTLGLDAGRKRAEFEALAPIFRSQGAVLASMFVLFALMGFMKVFLRGRGIHLPFAPFLPLLFVAPVAIGLFRPTKVVIGLDGISLRWLWRKRFIAMSEILAVTAEGETKIRVRTKDGADEIIATANPRGSRGGLTRLGRARRDAIHARMMEAWNAYREHGPTADVTTLIARGTRSPSAWREALAALDQRSPDYRTQAVRDEDLWRVLEDPHAREDVRAAAVLLLRKQLDDEGKSRVRIAAEATASPRLRIVLDAAASGADELFESALDEIATEPLQRASG